MSDDRVGETSESIRKRVQAARNIQQQCFASSQSDIICNADMRGGGIRQFCKLLDEGDVLSLSKHQGLMRAAMTQLNLSAGAYHRILKLARMIADLAGSEDIQSVHLAEALYASQPSEVDDGMTAKESESGINWRYILPLQIFFQTHQRFLGHLICLFDQQGFSELNNPQFFRFNSPCEFG